MLPVPLRVRRDVHALQTHTQKGQLPSSGHGSPEHRAAAGWALQCGQKARFQSRLETYIFA